VRCERCWRRGEFDLSPLDRIGQVVDSNNRTNGSDRQKRGFWSQIKSQSHNFSHRNSGFRPSSERYSWIGIKMAGCRTCDLRKSRHDSRDQWMLTTEEPVRFHGAGVRRPTIGRACPTLKRIMGRIFSNGPAGTLWLKPFQRSRIERHPYFCAQYQRPHMLELRFGRYEPASATSM
jgi:hypothetical protein